MPGPVTFDRPLSFAFAVLITLAICWNPLACAPPAAGNLEPDRGTTLDAGDGGAGGNHSDAGGANAGGANAGRANAGAANAGAANAGGANAGGANAGGANAGGSDAGPIDPGPDGGVDPVVLFDAGTPTWRRRMGTMYPGATGTYTFDTVEAQVGSPFEVYSTFISFDSAYPGQPGATTTHTELTQAAVGHELLIAWMPTRTAGLTFADILAGKYDAHIDGWLKYLGTLPTHVVIRFAHEMNGSWSQYHPLYSGSTSGSSHCVSVTQFKDVWRYMVNRQRALGTTNIRWFWCPNVNDVPTGGPKMEAFYPGASYVDIIGYDSYNAIGPPWKTALQTLAGNSTQGDAYNRVTALHASAEVWVGEIGCLDANDPKDVSPVVYTGHSKAAWWVDFWAVKKTSLPRLTTINYFDTVGSRDWRLDTSPAALAAFKKGFNKP